MQASQYENIAQSLLDEYAVGSSITGAALQKWVADHPDGAAIKSDLDIADPKKRINTLRRHINNGAASDNFAEDRRFFLDVEDAKRQVFVVRSLADQVLDIAKSALDKSYYGAINPLKRSQKAINAVKLDELPEIEREAMERARDNVAAIEKAVKPTFAAEVDRIWIAEMGRRGIPEDQARKIRAALPEVTRLQKLLRATA
jgi:hypothetical protein